MTSDAAPPTGPTDEVVDLCRDLLRIDTTNTGDTPPASASGVAAEYVAAKLAEVGLDAEIHESAPGRANVVARIPGADPARGALLVHGHLDVVPADADEWSVHPFSGEMTRRLPLGPRRDRHEGLRRDGARRRPATGGAPACDPPRDIVLAFTADEEAGSEYGAHYLVARAPRTCFDGCTEAIGEVGGFSYTVNDDLRLYLIETAEKGIDWLRLHAKGRPGHGSMMHDDNAVTALAEAVARVGRHRFPMVVTPTGAGVPRRGLRRARHRARPGRPGDRDRQARPDRQPDRRDASATPPTRPGSTPATRTTSSPAGPRATIDCRTLPGQSELSSSELRELIGPDIDDRVHPAAAGAGDRPSTARWSTRWRAALRAEDPGARPVPYMLSGGTDAKAFDQLGIRCFGFAPLRLPADLNFAALFHGIDERVPVDGLQFGVRVLDRFLRDA